MGGDLVITSAGNWRSLYSGANVYFSCPTRAILDHTHLTVAGHVPHFRFRHAAHLASHDSRERG